MNSLDKARNDPRITSLLKTVSSHIKLKFERSKDNGWGNNLDGDIAKIAWTGCAHPSASLAHELLHIQLQLNGYKRIRIGISNITTPEVFKSLMECVDNEIQHHKIYPQFIALGFLPSQFYRDDDAYTEEYLRDQIKRGFNSAADAAIDFFSFIAPGGQFSNSANSELRSLFYGLEDGKFATVFNVIESAVADWKSAQTNDAYDYVKRIFLAIHPINNLTWYGHSISAHPSRGEGVFVGQEFDVGEP